ncbi:MAG: cystathionine beta-synthase [Micavibrio aeruginosavorus]|uniref:Cystathionine beta-synthase n=1 Tax=Micavibrio aeruginosavorus TaxID=349221 RepID=A0A2W5FI91_9BACT|nr:MAG: cystathionine beta-synthase [Micavibrio aeruginosavorus]
MTSNDTNRSILDLIGNTPLVRVRNIDTGPCELFLKLESQNPGGSIKDRIALSMIEAAEVEGKIKPGDTLVEATAGNTGLGLTLVASQKGYKLILVIPDKMSQEKIFHMKAMGAEVIMTRSDVMRGHPDYYQDKAKTIADNLGAFYVNQFENPANPLAHEKTTGPELWEQMDHDIDALVCGVGSGGTLSGVGHYLKNVSPKTKMILADPKGSVLAPYVEHGIMIEAGSWLVEGIGEDFIPDNCDLSLVSQAFTITDAESIATSQEILKREGILCGSSSGTLIAAALKYCRSQKEKKRVVTFVCDSGNKYLSKIYNPFWLNDQGLTSPEIPSDDLRDLIARQYKSGDVAYVAPEDTLHQVYAKMKMFDVSQVPVIDNDEIIGLIDETDVLMNVIGNPNGFRAQAGQIMTENLVMVDVSQTIADLLPIFEKGRVASVTENGKFLGLITSIDLLNHLRKRTGKA